MGSQCQRFDVIGQYGWHNAQTGTMVSTCIPRLHAEAPKRSRLLFEHNSRCSKMLEQVLSFPCLMRAPSPSHGAYTTGLHSGEHQNKNDSNSCNNNSYPQRSPLSAKPFVSAHLLRYVQHERVLDHLPRTDGLAQGPLGRLFERCSGNMSARAVSPQPKQVRARKLGDLEDAFHVGGLTGVGHGDGCTARVRCNGVKFF